MSRYSVTAGGITSKPTAAAAGWLFDLRTSTSRDIRVLEMGVFAETAVASTLILGRSTLVAQSTATTVVTPVAEDPNFAASSASLFTAGTGQTFVVPTTIFRRIALPATIGAGVIWTFDNGIVQPTQTASTTLNGLMLWQSSTAAVTYSVYLSLEE